MGKRYTIALYIGPLENDYSKEVMLGVTQAAQKLNVNLVIFPVRYIDTVQHDLMNKKYQYQYNSMFSYAGHDSFDAVIIETAVMSRYVKRDVTAAIINSFKDTPIITISEKIKNCPCVSFNSNSIELEVEHLVKHHNRKYIGFVGGPSTNAESLTRLNVYKRAIEKCGLTFNPDLIVEGDFTEYCNGAVAELISRNKGRLDAICFASDLMAVAGYAEIERSGLEIGRDILVTGFDDIPGSTKMKPPLTTIHASSRELGSYAVEACINLIENGQLDDVTVDTKLVTRDSCGCVSDEHAANEVISKLINDKNTNPETFVNVINSTICSVCRNESYTRNKRIISLFLKFTFILLKQAGNPQTQLDKNLFIFKFNTLLRYSILNCVSTDIFNSLLQNICDKAISIADPPEKKDDIYKLFFTFYKDVLSFKQNENNMCKEEIKDNVHATNSIMNNMLSNTDSSDQSYLNVMHKFRSLNIKSSYIFIHETPVMSESRHDWVQPESEILHSYHIGDEFKTPPPEARKISAQDLFRNQFLPEERFTFIASPLFFNDENYGLLLCDIDTDDYIFYNSLITSQLSYAIKLKGLLEDQKLIQSHLIDSLNKIKTNNQMLSQISKSDELTGVYNRRGFIENVNAAIKRNSGRCAVIVYADMDNLKLINDNFGHDEGDYAIKKSSEILRECVRSNDIIARFGGDEFAAFALTHEINFKEIFMERLENICSRINRTNDKPYLINLSIGVHEFICGKNTDLTKIMNEADKKLYIDKKRKNKNIFK
ncbi:MAG: GGDEF domain-containing protein [Oscillospiraceae bacterium]|nr:GGDEF domain-containing protein [Oscillospiraceae bacterium]